MSISIDKVEYLADTLADLEEVTLNALSEEAKDVDRPSYHFSARRFKRQISLVLWPCEKKRYSVKIVNSLDS